MKPAPFSISRDARKRLKSFIANQKPGMVVALIWGGQGPSPHELRESVIVGTFRKDERDEAWDYDLEGLTVSVSPAVLDALKESEIVLTRLPASDTHPAYTYFDRIRK